MKQTGKRLFSFAIILCVLMSFAPFIAMVSADMPDIQLLDFNDPVTYTKYVKVGSILNDFVKNTSIYEAPADMSGQWNQTTALTGSLSDFCLYDTAQDWTGYGYLNIRLYSPEANNADYNILLFSGTGTYSGQGYNRAGMKTDKQGWYTVSIPLSTYGTRIQQIRGIGFTLGGWGSAVATNTYMCMSNIWVSETLPAVNHIPDPEPTELNDIVLLDFNRNTTYTKYTKVGSIYNDFVKNTANVETPATKSGQWNQTTALTGSHNDFCLYSTAQNWSEYGYLNLRIYAPEANGAIYQIILFQGAATYGTGLPYARVNITISEQGWQTVSIPLSSFSTLGGMVRGIAFTYGSNAAVTDNTYICMSTIWVSEEEPTGLPILPEPDPDEMVLLDFNRNTTYTKYTKVGTIHNDFAKNTANVEAPATKSGQWNQTTALAGSLNDFCLYSNAQNWSEYGYLNLRIYAPEANGAIYQIILFKGASTYAGDGYARVNITISEQGWQTVSIPMSSFSTLGGMVRGIAFTYGGWGAAATDNTYICMSTIWTTKELPTALPVMPAPDPDELQLLDFNEDITYTSYTKVGTIHNDFIKNADIFESPKTKSGQWNQTLALNGSHNDFTLYEDAQNWAEYGYINLRIYAPEANGAIYQIILFSGASTYAGQGYNRAAVTISEQGWQTVSIPLSTYGAARTEQVRGIAFTYGAAGAAVTDNTYICLENVWISKELPPEPTPDKIQLLDFNENQTYDSYIGLGDIFNDFVKNTTIFEAPAAMSGQWNQTESLTGSHNEFCLYPAAQDWSEYGYLNLRIFAPVADSAAYQIFLFSGASTFSADGYDSVNIVIEEQGWQTISIPLSAFGTRASEIRGIAFTYGSCDSPVTDGSYICMSTVWVSKHLDLTPPESAQDAGFIVSGLKFERGGTQVSNLQNGPVKAIFKITNTDSSGNSLSCIAAIYENGVLKSIQPKELLFEANDTSEKAVPFDSFTVTDAVNSEIRIFVFDSVNTIKPLLMDKVVFKPAE